MDMHQPPAHVRIVQAEVPVESPPVKVDVTKYIPYSAVSVTLIVTVAPTSGSVLVYAPGNETDATLFKGPASVSEVRLAGPFIYVKLLSDATSFHIQYLNWREP
jgi:hypothetical protein